jgi:prepilin-type N-terminal cleavage/methylation domain-containing protein
MFSVLLSKHINIKNGFTLLELLTVIMISGVMLAVAYPRFTQSNTALLQTHSRILWILRNSRETALTFSHDDQQVFIDIDKKTVRSYLVNSALNDKKELSSFVLPSSIIILKGRGKIRLNYLGEINSKNNKMLEITLVDIHQPKKNTKTIILMDGGYAY